MIMTMTWHLVIVHLVLVDGGTEPVIKCDPVMTTIISTQYSSMATGIPYHLWSLKSGH